MTQPRAAAATPAHHDLVALARREQALLTAALSSLFTRPALDQRISQALGYPGWPQPLTLLPHVATPLVTATPQLATYLAFAEVAGRHAIAAVAHHGWPNQPAEADATWLLLQHADPYNEQRHALLTVLADAVREGRADPRHLALLSDRVRVVHGEPQQYGTLRLIRDDRPALLYPLARNTIAVDTARAAIGLPSLDEDAQYAYSPLMPYGSARVCSVNPWPAGGLQLLHAERAATIPPENPESLARGQTGAYLAATLRYRNQIHRIRDDLPPPLVSTSRWLDIDPLTRASNQFDAGPALNQLAARLCLTDIAHSNLLIAFAQQRSHGLGVELGIALTHGIPVILIGPPQCFFDIGPQVSIVTSLDQALTAAVDLAHQPAASRSSHHEEHPTPAPSTAAEGANR